MASSVNHERARGRSFSFTDTSDCSSLWNEDDVVEMDVFTACSIGQYHCVQQHLADGMEYAELDKPNCGGWTPLMYAAYVGHDSIVNLLLDCHVDVNARTTKYGATSLMLAASCGNESVVFFLLQNGAKIDEQDNRGWSGLYYATVQGHQNVVKLLLDNGASKELRESKQGLTPLLVAAKEGHEVIYEMLCSSGANTNAKTSAGETARSLALQHENMAIVNIIDRQRLCSMPNYFLRSEPGLLPEDGELDNLCGVPSNRKVEDWLQHRNHSLEAGIQDGPEAFARLMSNHCTTDIKPITIPFKQGKNLGIDTGVISESPHRLSVTPTSNSEGTIGSFEEHFFINCGKTVESASLHRQLQKMNLENQNLDVLRRSNGDGMCQSSKPTVASFLVELNLAKYIPIFEEQDVDFDTLITFTDRDLKEVGVTLFGPRRKISTAITRWKEEHSCSIMSSDFNSLNKFLHSSLTEVQKLQFQLNQERQLRVVAEGCVLEERAKRQEIYTRVCKLQEQWEQTEGELERLKALEREIARSYLPADVVQDLHNRLESSITNLTRLASVGTVGTNKILFGNRATTVGNSSESSGNSSL